MLGPYVMAKYAAMIASMRSSIHLLWSYLALLEPPMNGYTNMYNPSANNIWLQPGTRAHMLVYRGDHWEVWTATNSRSGGSAAWLGTYMKLYADGKCIQCIRTETEWREFIIRPAQGIPTDE